ncbi:hypothetical protein Acr_24g0006700 [Actinidia rufa]|uniref:Lipoxygenase domain-containing protein n=1 Tax=Actinidia rufa TaxID=165716 RepID=A0A7J0GUG2_9ERIC|nr:hypothetical protein Acr_24g0006700 [Actinidia rufa]
MNVGDVVEIESQEDRVSKSSYPYSAWRDENYGQDENHGRGENYGGCENHGGCGQRPKKSELNELISVYKVSATCLLQHVIFVTCLLQQSGTPKYAKLESNPDSIYQKTITTQFQNLLGIFLIEILSRHSTDEVYLGPSDSPGWTSDAQPLEAFKSWGEALLRSLSHCLEPKALTPPRPHRSRALSPRPGVPHDLGSLGTPASLDISEENSQSSPEIKKNFFFHPLTLSGYPPE